jgi:hypothetical protein
VALEAQRVSRDIDLFHDTTEAVVAAWLADRAVLLEGGYAVTTVQERPGFVQAMVARGPDSVLVEWLRDSAFRFFPLVEHEVLGLTLHPFDLATNKVLALVGRVEARDWVDTIACDERVQPLGYLAWAACGKDPGFSPVGLLGHARRSSRYSAEELSALAFEGSPPDPEELATRWRRALDAADRVVAVLPAVRAGQAVLTRDGALFRDDVGALSAALDQDLVVFHPGRIGGAVPQLRFL